MAGRERVVVVVDQLEEAWTGGDLFMQVCSEDPSTLAHAARYVSKEAKDFATEITIHNARTNNMRSEPQISREHVTNNAAVRQTLLNRGIRPESLPPDEDVMKVERRLTSETKKALKAPEKLKGV